MAFCTQCGAKLTEGVRHQCGQAETAASAETEARDYPPAAGRGGYDLMAAAKQVDGSRIIGLLKNPHRSFELGGEKDLMYGLIGLAASLAGFLFWALIVGLKLNSMFVGFGGLGVMPGIDSATFGKLALVGLISLASFLAALWLSGYWTGSRNLSIQAFVTYVGGMQVMFGAAFAAAGLLAILKLQLGFFALMIVSIANYVVTVMGVSELYAVPAERRVSYVMLGSALYFVLFWLLSQILL